MSKSFAYAGDQAIIIQDGTILWNDESNDGTTLQYFDANDSSINESYATAIGSNETQYLSILDASNSNSNGISLEDLQNLVVEHEEDSVPTSTDNGSQELSVQELSTTESPEKNDADENCEVVVFTMDGSDDLYGIQMTHDDAGNIQKYQFKFRATPDGQLEPIPETVTLLPDDNQLIQQESDEIQQTGENATESPEGEQEYFLVRTQSDCNEESLIENGQVEDLNLQHVYIKGESDSLQMCEPTDDDNMHPDMLQDCIEPAPEDTQLESHLQNICVKTETSLQSHSQSTVNVKAEQFLETEGDGDFEEELFDENLQSSVICKDEQEQYVINSSNEMQLYEQQETETPAQFEQSTQNHKEKFLKITDSPQSHEELVQQLFCGEHSQIEVQYETELEPAESPRQSEYSETYENHENHVDYSVEYIQQADVSINQNSDTELCQHTEICEDELVEAEEAQVDLMKARQQPAVQRTNILKNSANSDKGNKSKLRYYVVYREKENVNSLDEEKIKSVSQVSSQPKLTRLANPRSVLRTSFAAQKEHRQKRNTSSLPETDLFDKRFARNKDALRAKHFHNFLNKTTIPHAPIRQQRQPRKQEIKPIIERSRGEIIIQEVIVSSNGFVERLNRRSSENRVTAVVELSDSEEEATLDRKRKRQSRRTSDSDKSVILINSDNEDLDKPKESSTDKETTGLKRSRTQRTPVRRKRKGKHRKICKKDSGEPIANKDLKNSENDLEENTLLPLCDNRLLRADMVDPHKKEKICPHCPKTFPSQNSLNTHLIHHNLENSLKNKTKLSSNRSLIGNSTKSRQSLLRKIEYNHKCEKCDSTFKNIILLRKHKCVKNQISFNCSLCLKQFNNIVLFNTHRKVHVKSNLVKTTSFITVSPKKAFQKPLAGVGKSPLIKSAKKFVSKTFKCRECPKVCDSQTTLSNHLKVHKIFGCSSCFTQFPSKLLLDNHRTTNCVKVKPGNKRLPLFAGKSIVRTPSRSVSDTKSTNKIKNSPFKRLISPLKLNCYKCQKKFSTFRNLYAHKVQIHGLHTLNKTLLTKSNKVIYKPIAAHGGTPANVRLRMASTALRKKLVAPMDIIVE